jgi:hypothetical protein
VKCITLGIEASHTRLTMSIPAVARRRCDLTVTQVSLGVIKQIAAYCRGSAPTSAAGQHVVEFAAALEKGAAARSAITHLTDGGRGLGGYLDDLASGWQCDEAVDGKDPQEGLIELRR